MQAAAPSALASASRSWDRAGKRLMFGVRPAVLVDYSMPSAARVMNSLRKVGLYFPTGPLAFIEIENFLYAVNVSLLLEHIRGPALAQLIFIAIDASFDYPVRLAGDDERKLRGELASMGQAVCSALNPSSTSTDQRITFSVASPQLLIPLAGWLLGYSVAYCFKDYAAVEGRTCLAHIPLHCVSVTTVQSDGTEAEVFKFTVPEKHWSECLQKTAVADWYRKQIAASTLTLRFSESTVQLSQVAI